MALHGRGFPLATQYRQQPTLQTSHRMQGSATFELTAENLGIEPTALVPLSGGLLKAAEAVAALSAVDRPQVRPYLQALAEALREVASKGEPLVAPAGFIAMAGTANKDTLYDTDTITLDQLAERVKAMQDELTKLS